MTRTAQIVAYIDSIDQRSQQLLHTIDESNDIISRLCVYSQSLVEKDDDIEALTSQVSSNLRNLSDLNTLYEKSLLLESNLRKNDSLTNKFTLDSLHNEYMHIRTSFQFHENEINTDNANTETNSLTTNEPEPEYSQHPDSEIMSEAQTPTLSNRISLSNLKLKPIRCNSKKIYKKKSRYRLSSIYNINPIAYDECSSPCSVNDEDRDDVESLTNQINYKDPAFANSDETLKNNDNYIDLHLNSEKHASLDNYNSDSESTVISHAKRIRSNSLPESSTIFSQAGVMKQSNILHKFHPDHSPQLTHFVSQPNLYRSNFDMEIRKSPTIDIDMVDIDDISIFSNDDDLNPTDNTIDDNFDNYLRKSRVNLVQDFPQLIHKSKLHDSILSTQSMKVADSFKFHNPINSVKSSNPTVEPTIENLDTGVIHCKGIKRVSFDLKNDPKQLLSEVISRNNENLMKSTPGSVSPKPSLIDFFQFTMNSSEFDTSHLQTPVRRHSSTEIWANNILNMINSKEETPEKIRELKSKSKTKPISFNSEVQSKRQPIRIPGAHSRLTIGPGNTRIINHGVSSPFRRPIASKVSHTSLREALSQSMM